MEKNPENKIKSTRFTFQKEERLCSKKQFDRLFAEGNSLLVYPLKVVFIELAPGGNFPVQAAFAVGKRLFKRAVKRNLIKRRMREAYRMNKPEFYLRLNEKKVAVVFIFIGKEIMEYNQIETAMKKALKRIAGHFSK